MKIRSFLLAVMLIAVSVCTFQTSVAQQPTERVISRLPIEQGEPIAITGLKVNDQSVTFGKKFKADDDWLKTLVVSIRNKSDKLILFASIQLQFPRSDMSGEIPIYDIWHGNWSLQMKTPSDEDRRTGLTAGATIDLGHK